MTSQSIPAPYSQPALAASIGKNTLFGVLGNVVHVLSRILVVPVMIRHLGVDGYGIWAVLMSIALYFNLGGSGTKSAFQKYVAEATGTRDFDSASRLLSTGTVAAFLISFVVLVPLGIFSDSLALAAGVPKAFLYEASMSIRLLAAMSIIGSISQTYQSIIMGAHRIDLWQKFFVILEPLCAFVTILLLYLGFGILASTAAFCFFQIAGGVLVYIYARRVLPDVHIAPRFVSRSVVKELVRFAGSYQLVSMLGQLDGVVLSVIILKFFGANATGVLAIAARLVSFATMIQGSYLQAILSGGSLAYASGSAEQVKEFIVKSFKVMAVFSVLPLSFIAFYGVKIAFVWTGKTDPLLAGSIYLLCASGVCRSLNSLFRVLYRISGGAVMDNAQTLSALAIALALWPFAQEIGFFGVVAIAYFFGQFFGLILLSLSLRQRFTGFRSGALTSIFLRFCAAAAVILGASVGTLYLNLSWGINPRAIETIRLLTASAICFLVAVPALRFTGSVSRSEVRIMWNMVSRRFVSS